MRYSVMLTSRLTCRLKHYLLSIEFAEENLLPTVTSYTIIIIQDKSYLLKTNMALFFPFIDI